MLQIRKTESAREARASSFSTNFSATLRELYSGGRTARRLIVAGLAALLAGGLLFSGPAMLSAQDEGDAGLTLDKSYAGYEDVDEDGEISPGDVLSYVFTITNEGEGPLSAVALTDEMLGLEDVACGLETLGPGEFTECAVIYTLTEDDINAGELVNQATATALDAENNQVSAEAEAIVTGLGGLPATDQTGDQTAAQTDEQDSVTADDEETIELPQAPAIALAKSHTGFEDEDGNGTLGVGDVMSFTFAITNTGNVTLGSIALTDELLELDEATCEESELAPDASVTCVYTYVVTEEDVAAGEILNEATVTALGPGDVEVNASAQTTVELPRLPGITLEKTFAGFIDEDESGELSVGDVITFSFTIVNSGNVPLEPVTLDDEMLGLEAVICGQAELAPDETASCEYPYTITQADMDAGEINNRAVVTGTIAAP